MDDYSNNYSLFKSVSKYDIEYFHSYNDGVRKGDRIERL